MSTVYEARVEAELPAAGRLHQVGTAWSIQLLIQPESGKYHRSIEYQISDLFFPECVAKGSRL
jgi:hypothetical protein